MCFIPSSCFDVSLPHFKRLGFIYIFFFLIFLVFSLHKYSWNIFRFLHRVLASKNWMCCSDNTKVFSKVKSEIHTNKWWRRMSWVKGRSVILMLTLFKEYIHWGLEEDYVQWGHYDYFKCFIVFLEKLHILFIGCKGTWNISDEIKKDMKLLRLAASIEQQWQEANVTMIRV